MTEPASQVLVCRHCGSILGRVDPFEDVPVAAAPAAAAEGLDALPVDLSDYMAGYRQAQADIAAKEASE